MGIWHDLIAAFPLVLLQAAHSVLSSCPLPPLKSAAILPEVLAVASSSNLVKLLNHSPRADQFTAGCPYTPGGVVMLVSEMLNIFLTASLLPPVRPDQTPFATSRSLGESETVQASHTERLLLEALPAGVERLSQSASGRTILQDVEQEATKWLGEIMEPIAVSESPIVDAGRRDSLFSIGGGAFDEEVELTVTVLVGSSL